VPELFVFDLGIVAGMVGEEVEGVRERSPPKLLADTRLTKRPVSTARSGSDCVVTGVFAAST